MYLPKLSLSSSSEPRLDRRLDDVTTRPEIRKFHEASPDIMRITR